jgi:hypothetical protein
MTNNELRLKMIINTLKDRLIELNEKDYIDWVEKQFPSNKELKNKKITIDISDCDIEHFEKLVHNNYDPFTWTFDGVDVEFVKSEEEE